MFRVRSLTVLLLATLVLAGCYGPGSATGDPSADPTQSSAPTASPTASPTTTPRPTAEPTAEPTDAPTSTPERTLTPTLGVRPANDDPPGTFIQAVPFEDSLNVTAAQVHAMELASACGSGSQSVWYALTPTASGTYVADTEGSDYDTILDVFVGSLSSDFLEPGFEELVPLACNDNTGDSVQAGIVFEAVAGQSYVIRITTGLNSSGGNLRFSLSGG